MTDSDIEPGDIVEATASRAMWYEVTLPNAGLGYVVLYVLLQIVLLPVRWLRRTLSHQPH
jgi:putative effector of murein hydrolase LrgA (UPF0299 family)